MNKITFNDDKLTMADIQDRIIKARAIILNDNGDMFLSKYNEMYLLPGGKIEDDEDITQGLLREVKEETGIELDIASIEPFLYIEQFIKSYPRRNTEDELSNRYNGTYYYVVHTNEDINTDKMSLMENEINANFETLRINPEQVLSLIEQNTIENPRNKYFSRELTIVVQELLKK